MIQLLSKSRLRVEKVFLNEEILTMQCSFIPETFLSKEQALSTRRNSSLQVMLGLKSVVFASTLYLSWVVGWGIPFQSYPNKFKTYAKIV